MVTLINTFIYKPNYKESFSMYTTFSKKLPFLPSIFTRTCAYQKVRNGTFSKKFESVLNEYCLTKTSSTSSLYRHFVTLQKCYYPVSDQYFPFTLPGKHQKTSRGIQRGNIGLKCVLLFLRLHID